MIEQQSIHGHEVIFLVHDAPKPLTRAELEKAVQDQFGADARFHTCSMSDLTLEQLLQFLLSKGKLVERQGRLQVNLAEVCDHGH